ncbi:transmembrane protein 254 [Protobothrops mucrosquamatus]|uniref:transmembrane protein 254 n=1 Tax=Protobothrops mucrosquamatus TaxID=103944 RepID=UPI000775D8E7|nr:transmembrane protein 254 [Protobothrops mucrosquamatus]
MACQSASAARSDNPATYFRRTRPFFVVVIVAAMLYYGCAIFAPSIIPYDGLGPLGRFTKYLQENHKTLFHVVYLVSWLLHIGEAFLSIWLCNKKGITDSKTQLCWFIQTLLCGIMSFYFLLVYKPQKKTK